MLAGLAMIAAAQLLGSISGARRMLFAGDCTGLDGDLILELKRRAKSMAVEDFLAEADPKFIEDFDAQGSVPLAEDWHVGFFEGPLPGSDRRAIYFAHSGIEHVFTDDGEIHDDEIAAAKE